MIAFTTTISSWQFFNVFFYFQRETSSSSRRAERWEQSIRQDKEEEDIEADSRVAEVRGQLPAGAGPGRGAAEQDIRDAQAVPPVHACAQAEEGKRESKLILIPQTQQEKFGAIVEFAVWGKLSWWPI